MSVRVVRRPTCPLGLTRPFGRYRYRRVRRSRPYPGAAGGGDLARVLIVDDEASMRFLLRRTFESAGHDVEEATNGVAALQRIDGGRVPDMVATDFMMPLMNGGELIARLRADPATARVAVILVSSSPGSEVKTTADAFFRKPFDPSALLACAAGLLGGRR